MARNGIKYNSKISWQYKTFTMDYFIHDNLDLVLSLEKLDFLFEFNSVIKTAFFL